MKLEVTVNLGNYENIKIASSEYDDIDDCRGEVKYALMQFGNEPRVADFIKKYFRGSKHEA